MTKKSKLTDYKRAVLITMTMRLTRREALAYLAGEGYPMSIGTLGRIKSELRRNSLSRMHQIAAYEFHEQHLARIDNCELIAKLMWQEYLRERSPYKRVMILKEIKEIQPYLSSYYQTTKMVLESKNGELAMSPLDNNYNNNYLPGNSAAAAAILPQMEIGYEETQIPPVDDIDERNRFDRWSIDSRPMSAKYVAKMESKYGIRDGLWFADEFVQCEMCKRWFQNENMKANHTCITGTAHHHSSNRWSLLPNNNNNSNDNNPSSNDRSKIPPVE